jgi:dipeptidyl aminopeptidase/acylaminoacyl peptidase
MKLLFNFLFVTFLFSFGLNAQKKIIDHNAYFEWKKTEKQQISSSGNFVTYEKTPLKGDGYLFIYNSKTQKLDSIFRGKDAKIAFDESLIAFKVTPGFDTLRKCELNKIDKKKWPKDSLFIYLTKEDSLIKIPKLKSFSIGEEGGELAYLTDGNELTQPKKKKFKLFKKKKKEEPKSDGNVLTYFQLDPKKSQKVKNVIEFSFSKDGSQLAFIEHTKLKVDSFSLNIKKVSDWSALIQLPKRSAYKLPEWNKSLDKIAFLSSSDTAKTKQYILNIYDIKTKKNRIISDTLSLDFDRKLGVSEFQTPIFTENRKYMFFGVSDRVKKEVKDSLLESEKVKVDVWHYLDKRIQPQQLVELKEDKKRSDLCVYNFETDKVIQLTNDTLNAKPNSKIENDFLLATSNEQYAIQAQWKSPELEDVYRISIKTGEVKLIERALSYGGQLSPSGSYYSYFNPSTKQHYLKNIDSNKTVCVTCNWIGIRWDEDVNGQPTEAGPEGVYGYTRGEQYFLFKSEYDIWAFDISGNNLLCLTEQKGEKRKVKFDLVKWSSDSVYIDLKDCYAKGFDTKSKGEGIYKFYDETGMYGLFKRYDGAFKINSLSRSKDKSKILLRRMNLAEYPEIRMLDSSFTNEKVLSKTNPQQANYNWATVELVKWKSYDGTELEGLLYKPEDYSSSKKYPLLLYYYELNSGNLHNHQAPRPSASTINPLEYASAGYLVFIPDIRYVSGQPAKSAYNSILSATDYLIKNYSVDSTKMGLQGQSWGGYQTARLITMTKRYAAAMAGAPVGNMFSAYGGIRWGSGLNRQFQYESQQSRIGKTIWEAPNLYVENSPLFHLPKVSTLLLMMHNDKDGAVPWYQGIELYNGMRRLGKPCWLLNYNEDDHNLTKLPYKIDLSIRMRQFFDHYLQGKPMPIWMKDGIQAIDKGEKFGYERE